MNRRRAFTLMEVILATALSAVLLLSLWGVFGTYLRMFDSGHERTLHSQLIRGLRQQIADDLASAIQDNASPPTGSTGAVRRFGMFGTSRELQIDILQPVPLADASTTSDGANLLAEVAPASQAFEFHTVRYSMRPLTDYDESGQPAPPGLVRQELDFRAPAEVTADTEPGEASDQLAWTDTTTTEETDDLPPEELSVLSQTSLKDDDDQITWVPEVVAIEFRYYDGTAWSSVWNSIERKSLPVAVEAVIQLAPLHESAPRSANSADSADTSTQDTPANSDILQPNDGSNVARGTIFRVLVNLPKSALRYDIGNANAMASVDADDELLDESLGPDFADDSMFTSADPLGDDDPTGFGGLMTLTGPMGDGGDPMSGNMNRGRGMADRLRTRSQSQRPPAPQVMPSVQPLAPDVWMRR